MPRFITCMFTCCGDGRMWSVADLTVTIEEDTRMSLSSADVMATRAERLRELFPETFTEGRIGFQRLRESLGDAVDDGAER